VGDVVAGAVVVVPFPFTTLAERKSRPALVLATFARGDVLLCQITSKSYGHPVVVALSAEHFEAGGLPRESWVLPHRLVTAHASIVERVAGRLSHAALAEVRRAVCDVVRGDETTTER
jgi:mRNA interferase MazF